MKLVRKYWVFFWIHFLVTINQEISFRMSFLASIIGSFVFVFMNLFATYFFIQKIVFPNWSKNEMFVLLGTFMLLYYSIFFLFWRGLTRLIKHIRNGQFDYYLLKPADTQFVVSIAGGGAHNLFAVTFGLFMVVLALVNANIAPSLPTVIEYLTLLILAVLDFYSFLLMMVSLNFRYGYLEEVFNFAFSFQDVSRYPTEAYSSLPLMLALGIIPFSALTTIPASILTGYDFPVVVYFGFIVLSVCFILLARAWFFRSIKYYTSGS